MNRIEFTIKIKNMNLIAKAKSKANFIFINYVDVKKFLLKIIKIEI